MAGGIGGAQGQSNALRDVSRPTGAANFQALGISDGRPPMGGGAGYQASSFTPSPLPAFPSFNFQAPSVSQSAPVQMNTNVAPHPELMQTLGSIRDYRGQMGAGSDVDAINAMQRQRDYASGQAKEASASAGSRGFAPGTGVNALMQERARRAGTQAAGNVNAASVSDARNKQLSALGLESGAAGNVAQNQLGAGQLAVGQYSAQTSANNAAAQLQALQNKQQTDVMMSLMNMYTGA